MFCFGGRQANLELQLPFIYKILDEHPQVTYHLWNLARNRSDDLYIRDLDDVHPHLEVRNDFAGGRSPWEHFDDVYRVYANHIYTDTLFVKLDDDVVFIETDRFGDFIDSIAPGTVLSAKVINNGACGVHFPEIAGIHKKLDFPLLDVHLYGKYAKQCHAHFLLDPAHYLTEEWQGIATDDWLSINFIGYDYDMAVRFTDLLGTKSPKHIAGRSFLRPHATLGDEGMVNTLPRVIQQGMTVCHLTFGPQEKKVRPVDWDELRAQYATAGKEYLG